MHTMLRVTTPVEKGNSTILDGSLPKVIEEITKRIHPEASYFMALHGKRTALFFFEMKDSSEIPQIAEIAFMGLNAEVEFIPVMNQAELQKGLAAWPASKG